MCPPASSLQPCVPADSPSCSLAVSASHRWKTTPKNPTCTTGLVEFVNYRLNLPVLENMIQTSIGGREASRSEFGLSGHTWAVPPWWRPPDLWRDLWDAQCQYVAITTARQRDSIPFITVVSQSYMFCAEASGTSWSGTRGTSSAFPVAPWNNNVFWGNYNIENVVPDSKWKLQCKNSETAVQLVWNDTLGLRH